MFRIKKIVLLLSVFPMSIYPTISLADSMLEYDEATIRNGSADDRNEARQVCTPSKTGKFLPIEPVITSGEPVPEDGGVRLTVDERIEGIGKQEAIVEGNVIIEREDQVLNADRVVYKDSTVVADELFRLKDSGNVLSGKSLEYDLDTGVGSIDDFKFNRPDQRIPLQGEGKKLEILQQNFYRLKEARVNTCNPGDDSWYIEAKEIKVDYDRNIGVAKNTKFVFKGVPLMMLPWFDFPLNGRRKSGFLNTMLSIKSGNGLELGLPYYLNLAPNYDMTVTPHLYTKRGLGVDSEFRYLSQNFSSRISASFLPSDRVAKKELNKSNRYAVSFKHLHDLTPKLFLGVDYNQVSDNQYFKDFGSRTAAAENNNLNRQVWLSYRDDILDGPFSAFFTVQNYQTLQNLGGTIDEPYRLEPQLSVEWSKLVYGATEIDMLAQVSNFDHRTKQTGIRALFYPRVTWDFSNEWGFFRPRIGLHTTRYQLDNHWSLNKDGIGVNQPRRNFSRVLPIFSMDTGLIFKKSVEFRGNRFLQTLEPRLFYTYVPNKEQSQLPNFDSERVDVTFSSLFRENRFTGHDRINSANNLSYSLATRLYNQKNGVEIFRAGIGQRSYFKKDNVSLYDDVDRNRKNKSDTLLFAQGQITDKISLKTDLYFNGNRRTDNRYVVSFRYQPELGKLLNLRYKYDKSAPWIERHHGKFEQIDFSFQWPIAKQYSVVGRYNYSLSDKKLLEALGGVEYLSECQCWGFNTVFQTYVTEYNKRKNAVFFQLNLRGLGGLGVNPFDELYRSIPGYRPKSEVK